MEIAREVPNEYIEGENEHRLVITFGTTKTEEALADPEFNIRMTQALKLHRNVEMYLFAETVHTHSHGSSLGGSKTSRKTYEYNPKWSSCYINHKNFKNRAIKNPGPEAFLFNSEDFFVSIYNNNNIYEI